MFKTGKTINETLSGVDPEFHWSGISLIVSTENLGHIGADSRGTSASLNPLLNVTDNFLKPFELIIPSDEYLRRKGTSKKLCRLIEVVLGDTKAKVMVANKVGEEFMLSKGVRQGDALSATLFNIALQPVMDSEETTGHINSYAPTQMILY